MAQAETSLEEFKTALGEIFNVMDMNGDKQLDRSECLSVVNAVMKSSDQEMNV